jgi:ABC-2 type transport system permease protein
MIGWGLGVFGVALMYAAVYPSIQASAADLRDYVENLPDAIKSLIGGEDYTSPTGYLRSEFFSSMGPLLVLIFAIGASARATAGEEEGRTLDILMSTPVRRRQVLFDKALAVAAVCALLAAVSFVAIAVLGPPFDLEIPLADLAAQCAMLGLLGMAFAGIALALGAITGRRIVADAVAGGFAVVAFIVNALAPSVSWLEPLRPLSPIRWYMEPNALTEGLAVANVVILAAVAVVGYAIAHVAFDRRDLQG